MEKQDDGVPAVASCAAIDASEEQLLRKQRAELAKQSKLEAAFRTFDVDGSGTLSNTEFRDVLLRDTGLGAALTIADVERLIVLFDENDDGELNLSEFIKAMCRMDTNNDGVLSGAELGAALPPPPPPPKLKKGDAGYGRPVAGSRTEARAQEATAWVEAAIDSLVAAIRQHGSASDGPASGAVTITFGALFEAYETSDSLVGLLMRARKRKRIKFECDGLLFRGIHDHVVITALS